MIDEKNNSGDCNSGNSNSGNSNSGYCNSGNCNSGNCNSGNWNSGNWNSGNCNSGYGNSGYGNSGNRSSGDCNSGNSNSGNSNSGNSNSGNRSSGYKNSGNCNSGNWNSGYGNSGNRSSGIFCTVEPTVISFNKPTSLKWSEIQHPTFEKFYLNKWILESEMTERDKIQQKDFHVRGGYLKTYTWEEAWQNYWRDSDEREKQLVLNLPNFDSSVFKEITGIDVISKNSCSGKIVEIEGVKYKLQEVKDD